jgi:hypothetical protein
MSLSESKCWYSNKCLHFLRRAVPLKWERRASALIGDGRIDMIEVENVS